MNCIWNFVTKCIPSCIRKTETKARDAPKPYLNESNGQDKSNIIKLVPCKQSLVSSTEITHNNLDQRNTTLNFSDKHNESLDQQLKKIGQELLSAQTEILTITSTKETVYDKKSQERILSQNKNLINRDRRTSIEPNYRSCKERKNITINSNLPGFIDKSQNTRQKKKIKMYLSPQKGAYSQYKESRALEQETQTAQTRSNDSTCTPKKTSDSKMTHSFTSPTKASRKRPSLIETELDDIAFKPEKPITTKTVSPSNGTNLVKNPLLRNFVLSGMKLSSYQFSGIRNSNPLQKLNYSPRTAAIQDIKNSPRAPTIKNTLARSQGRSILVTKNK